MYTHPIFIALSIVFISVAPILYVNSMQKRKRKKELDRLLLLARENNFHPDKTVSLPSLLLGLEAGTRRLMVVHLPSEQLRITDLKEFKACDVHLNRTADRAIDRIFLNLIPKDKGIKEVQILIYNEADEVNPDADRRLLIANTWKGYINEIIDQE